MITRRRMLKSGAVLGAGAFLTLNTPEIARAADALAVARRRPPDLTGTRLIATLAGGSGPDQLGLRTGSGAAPGGPQAIVALGDGRLAILDTLNGRIMYLTAGRPSGIQGLPGALYPLDAEAIGDGLAVLDPSARILYVVRGSTVSVRSLSRADVAAVSRLTRFRDAEMLVEEDAGTVDPRNMTGTRTRGFPDDRGGRLTVTYGAGPVPQRRSARIQQADGTTFDIVTTHALGSVVPLGRDAAARAYLLVSELVPSTGGLDVDITLRRFAADGTPAGVARVPVRGRESSPRRAACFAPNGDAFALFPEARQVRVLQLEWSPGVPPLLPLVAGSTLSQFIAHATHGPQYQIANCRTTAIDIGRQYAHGTWTAVQANLNHHLRSDVTKPQYLVGPGTYYELPYCWGGMHLPQGFINEMNAGSLAGNVKIEGGFKSGTSSVDCSGMIQQCWGVGGGVKQSDTSLMNWVTEHNTQDVGATLSPGDMWRLAGQHARMHRAYPGDGTGAYMIESTLDWGNKCYNAFRPWSDYVNYTWNKGNFAC